MTEGSEIIMPGVSEHRDLPTSVDEALDARKWIERLASNETWIVLRLGGMIIRERVG